MVKYYIINGNLELCSCSGLQGSQFFWKFTAGPWHHESGEPDCYSNKLCFSVAAVAVVTKPSTRRTAGLILALNH